MNSKLYSLLSPARTVSLPTMGWIVAATILADQASKLAAIARLPQLPDSLSVIPHLLDLGTATNTGAAFSMMTGQTGFLTLVSACVAIFILVWAIRLAPQEQGLRPAMGLILGGAVGNLIDRIRLGHVIDFIQAHWYTKAYWPTFNVADSAVCVGVGLLIAASLLAPREPQVAAVAGKQPETGRPGAERP